MGYIDNCLPKAIASLGHEVHLITSDVQPYFNAPDYGEIYEPFLGPGVVSCGVKEVDGYTLHRLPHMWKNGEVRIIGLWKALFKLRPQVVQTFETFSFLSYEAALLRLLLRYRLFLESHIHLSVFPYATGYIRKKERLKWFIYSTIMNHLTVKCYPISDDAAYIVTHFYGIEGNKVCTFSLGVDTELFRPPSDGEAQQLRLQLRARLAFSESDIVCIYTGRFTGSKNPLCLAQAIARLRLRGRPFRGLFVGSGPQVEAIQACPGCVVHPFVSCGELPAFYWAADIGVWPKQESTSQLDAAACALPLVLSNQIQVYERIDGNGIVYEEDDPQDLAQQLDSLSDPIVRQNLGEYGARKIQERFSWSRIARQRLRDYEAALQE